MILEIVDEGHGLDSEFGPNVACCIILYVQTMHG